MKRRDKNILVAIALLFLPVLAFGPGIKFIKKNFLAPSFPLIPAFAPDMSTIDNSVEIASLESSFFRSMNPKVPAFPKESFSYEFGKNHLLSPGNNQAEASIDVAEQFAWENSHDADSINDRKFNRAGVRDGIADIGLPEPYYNYPSIPETKHPDWAGSGTNIRGPSFAYLLPGTGGGLPTGGSSTTNSGSADTIPPGTGDTPSSGGSPPPHSGLADGTIPGLEESPPGTGGFLPDSGSGNPSAPTPVPEPGTWILFASGLIGVAVWRKKTERK